MDIKNWRDKEFSKIVFLLLFQRSGSMCTLRQEGVPWRVNKRRFKVACSWQSGVGEDLSSDTCLWIPACSPCLAKFSLIPRRNCSIFPTTSVSLGYCLDCLQRWTAHKAKPSESTEVVQNALKPFPSVSCFYPIHLLVDFFLVLIYSNSPLTI